MKKVILTIWYIVTLTCLGYIMSQPSRFSKIKDYPEYKVKNMQEELREILG
jgi:hypothetical protein